ncbi:MAG: hypothetical protein ACO1SX_15235, partial [Actinomycetota bacterium]
DYLFQKDDFDYPHRRPVQWLTTQAISVSALSEQLQKKLSQPITIVPLSASEFGAITDTSMGRHAPLVWWVYQGLVHPSATMSGLLWVPTRTTAKEVSEFDRIEELRPGDVVVHGYRGKVRGLSRVTESWVPADRPTEMEGSSFDGPGRLVRTDYAPLTNPIPYSEVEAELRSVDPKNGTWQHKGDAVQGSLWPFTASGLGVLYRASSAGWPEWAISILEESLLPPTPTYGLLPIIQGLRADGLYFSREVVSNYLLALQTKRFVILSGISGTGKTQLALSIAKQFPKVVERSVALEIPESAFEVKAEKYMTKDWCMILSNSLKQAIPFPPPDPEQKSIPLRVVYPGGETSLRLYSYPNRNTRALLFRGEFRKWFQSSIIPGARFFIEPLLSDDGIDGLRFIVPELTTFREQTSSYAIVPVRPDWTDNRGLLGYYNPISGTYRRAPALELIIDANTEWENAQAEERQAHPYFLILDEMNLARVEHYFSDFLSCLESDEPLHLHDDPIVEAGETEEALAVPRRLRIPPNLFFTGTVNIDETTYMFSPKVLDRAFTLEFNEVDLSGFGAAPADKDGLSLDRFPGKLQLRHKPASSDWTQLKVMDNELWGLVVQLHDMLREDNRHFGYRVANEIAAFLNLASEQAMGSTETRSAALDLALLQKVLPKFHGTQQELERPLLDLFAFAVSGTGIECNPDQWQPTGGRLTPNPAAVGNAQLPEARLPRTGAKVWRMLRRLRAQGFTSYME